MKKADQTMSKLLIPEPPLQVLPSLAKAIGLNQAIVLQQVHYWLVIQQKAGNDFVHREGKWWCYNTYQEWQENNFPWWCIRTIKRIFERLRERGLIITRKFNVAEGDHTLWYTVNYEKLAQLEIKSHSDRLSLCNGTDCHNAPSDHSDNLSRSTLYRDFYTERENGTDKETPFAALWQEVLHDLELITPRSTFATWFKGTRMTDITDGQLTIECPNQFAQDWLENRWKPKILDVLTTHLEEANLLDEDTEPSVIFTVR